ncbi:hypothetical protein [Streptomyces yanii]|uniref:Uncharacterized protein n=1 Tax=Streptomyces yanii TaxID=78510 RepID=A0ABV5R205_9ACTN
MRLLGDRQLLCLTAAIAAATFAVRFHCPWKPGYRSWTSSRSNPPGSRSTPLSSPSGVLTDRHGWLDCFDARTGWPAVTDWRLATLFREALIGGDRLTRELSADS